ncbi:MAG: dihydroorotase [Candidatus Omnitrophica bacterium]|jgi:dihydroorotase|nr:dihydroorotase [Candidatus Omnitrophota bacterium]MDD5080006.1 dihydroorotase [Candidatus Omnitrophota bacterium]
MKILIKNGRVVDPANNLDDIRDILVEGARISKVAKDITFAADETIDASGKIVAPGLIDMHVHLREPGREDKETVLTGTMAALKGGFTTILAMPNTQPAIDSIENVNLLKDIIRETARANVLIAAAITRARIGEEITDAAKLKKEGVIAVSDDGSSVESREVFFKAMKKAKEARVLVICHSEDKALSASGVVNQGAVSTRLGLRGISNESEYKRVQRDIQLAEKTKCTIHIAHVSCAESVEIIAKAKKKGVKVSAETCPHYFTLTEEAARGYDTNMKMNPPLRSRKDKDAIIQGLKKGILDAISSDHAPHTVSEKEIEFDRAEFGATGLETELAVSVTELIGKGVLDWSDLVVRMSVNPSRILGIDKGSLTTGKAADIVIIDPDKEWIVEKGGFVSKSKNSPFIGMKLKGLVEYTICAGKIAYKAGQ